MLLQRGDEGEKVKEVQKKLGLKVDGIYGPNTEEAVKDFQRSKNLTVDGIVGPNTISAMSDDGDTDLFTNPVINSKYELEYKGDYETINGLKIGKYYLDKGEYITSDGHTTKYVIFIHHTAGGADPYRTAELWNTDDRGRIATQYIIGGRDNDTSQYNGHVIETLPDNYYAWHLGSTGSHYMHVHSVGIELTSWGWLEEKNGKFYNYVGEEIPSDQVVDLCYDFKGHRYYHAYTDEQIDQLELLLKELSRKHNISLNAGLCEMIHSKGGQKAFELDNKAYDGNRSGILSHSNVRSDKSDCYPDDRLIELISSFK